MSSQTPAEEAKWLTPTQVAAQVQMDERTVRRACNDGEIPGATMRRGLWRIPEAAVERWMGTSE